MGPTITALSEFFEADKALRIAQKQLDAATRDVKSQTVKVKQLETDVTVAHKRMIDLAARAENLDRELKDYDTKINLLRERQSTAANNKEFQALLIDINNHKADQHKKSDLAIAALDSSEAQKKTHDELSNRLTLERSKFEKMSAEIDTKVAELTAVIESLKEPRALTASKLQPKIVQVYDRVAQRYDGEAMSPIERPEEDEDEYACSACGVSLVIDVYNRLHRKDELLCCTNCGRILYIPEDLPGHSNPQLTKKVTTKPRKTPAKSTSKKVASGPSMSGAQLELHRLMSKAQAESVKNANAAGNTPIEFDIFLDGKLFGHYKGQTVENYRRAAIYFLHESGINKTVDVYLKGEGPQPAGSAPTEVAAPVEASVEASVDANVDASVEEAAPEAPPEPTLPENDRVVVAAGADTSDDNA